jgi:predicted DNA-binding transcriptional regulator YafY
MRASRLLTIQMLLETRGQMSATALAEAVQISLRTLYRDIDQLSAAGVPVYAERGRNGGFRLADGWKTTLTGFTASEAQAVFLSGLAGPAAALGLGQEVIDAELKLVAALPTQQRGEARRIAERFHLDTVDWYREADPVPHLKTVAAAVWDEKQIAIRYESWKGEVKRTLSPLGLVLKSGAWYLVATSEGEARTYRVSNILDVNVLPDTLRRPKKFDLASYWHASVARFETELHSTLATVLATEVGLKQLRSLSAPIARALAEVKPKITSDGRMRVNVPVEVSEHTLGHWLRLAPEVEVIAPKTLRAQLKRRLAAVSACYC